MFGILGPLLVAPNGAHAVAIRSPKQRVLLALLLAADGRTVTIDQMVDELWAESPPISAVANVRTFLCDLRRLLGTERGRIVTRPGGYVLLLEPGDRDVDRFVTDVQVGREALRRHDLRLAVRSLRSAQRHWRGRALDDVPLGAVLRMHAVALEEQRLATWEELLHAQLSVGDHTAVLAGARRILTEHPTRETTWYLLISALRDSGNAAAALEAYQQARTVLIEHLGLDPGPRLAELQADILRRTVVSRLAPSRRLIRGDRRERAEKPAVERRE